MSAKNLPHEENRQKGISCDPFVICHFGKKSFRTRCINHNANPVWNESVYLNLRKEHLNNDLLINWKIYDYEYRSNDNILAQVDTTIQSVVDMCYTGNTLANKFEPIALSIELTPKTDKKVLNITGTPTLNIKCSFFPYHGEN